MDNFDYYNSESEGKDVKPVDKPSIDAPKKRKELYDEIVEYYKQNPFDRWAFYTTKTMTS